MKNSFIPALISLLFLEAHSAFAQGTAFTYQGQLQNNGNPASGIYNLTFTLFATNSGGAAVAGPVTNSAVAVSNGLFTVIIDLESSVWNGQTNWLEIGVETNSGNSFTTLAPRQQVTPTPYAIAAEGLNGTIPASQLTSLGNTNGGTGNFFVGPSGSTTNSGSDNTAIGLHALNANSTGSRNTANGFDALIDNTSGFDNTAYGVSALFNNTSGSENTANGYQALAANTSGFGNVAMGFQAGNQITTGNSNIDIGNGGLSSDNNIIRIGSGQTQTFIAGVINGNGGGLTNLSAAQLVSIGNTNSGGGNFFVGPSGNATTSGSDNTANGLQALNNNTTGGYNTANGAAALDSNTSGSQNTAAGVGALGFNSSGSFNTALGYLAGFGITTGSNNIDIGNQGLSTDTNIIRIGSAQTQTFVAGAIIGNGAGLTNLSAAQLVSIGLGTEDFFVGPSGNATTFGSDDTALGVYALENDTSGLNNTALGANALNLNTAGSANTANGANALVSNITGDSNTGIGWGVLYSNTNGNNNTAIGESALGSNTSGSNNIALGLNAGYNISTGSSNIDIGNQGFTTDNNIVRIGTTQSATYLSGTVYANGVALTSDRNAKEHFSSIDPQAVLAKVTAMPVTEWNYKDDKTAEHIGPMAQDFHAAFGLDGADDKHISVVDENGVALAAIQGLEAENVQLKKRLDELEAEVKALAQNRR